MKTLTLRKERFAIQAEVRRQLRDGLVVTETEAFLDLLREDCRACCEALRVCFSLIRPETMRALLPVEPKYSASGALLRYGTAEPEDEGTRALVEVFAVAWDVVERLHDEQELGALSELAASLRNQVFGAAAAPECVEEGLEVISPAVAHGLAHHLSPAIEALGERYEPALLFRYPPSFGPKYPEQCPADLMPSDSL